MASGCSKSLWLLQTMDGPQVMRIQYRTNLYKYAIFVSTALDHMQPRLGSEEICLWITSKLILSQL